ncbi:MAG: putative endonuclease, partial [Celeribacter sp.]
ARAAQSLSARQFARICTSAEDYISRTPKGFLTDMRVDVALVDHIGALEIHENASM